MKPSRLVVQVEEGEASPSNKEQRGEHKVLSVGGFRLLEEKLMEGSGFKCYSALLRTAFLRKMLWVESDLSYSLNS